ncbi:hypothetical protein NT01EI_0259 [Edwardsiella ictaluri 93-146]|uniref:Uncharacterized protein n=1 Tax=Edwardsiella ictaluri (strain 93-146) TaxID=634503 RepID=C5BCD9_EDWI9|nr:hypothetical protein NT01EI_0259 [Edwardsiella ictaluri 93-146]
MIQRTSDLLGYDSAEINKIVFPCVKTIKCELSERHYIVIC